MLYEKKGNILKTFFLICVKHVSVVTLLGGSALKFFVIEITDLNVGPLWISVSFSVKSGGTQSYIRFYKMLNMK